MSTPIEDWRLVLFAPIGIAFGTDGTAQFMVLVSTCLFLVLAVVLRKKLHSIVPLLAIALCAGALGYIGADRMLTIAHSI
jgi:lipoprotein signal peptidase